MTIATAVLLIWILHLEWQLHKLRKELASEAHWRCDGIRQSWKGIGDLQGSHEELNARHEQLASKLNSHAFQIVKLNHEVEKLRVKPVQTPSKLRY